MNVTAEDALPATDSEAAVQFLQALDHEAVTFSLRSFPEAPGVRGFGENYSVKLAEVPALLDDCARRGRGLFAVINAGGHKDAEIGRVRAVFLDFDRSGFASDEACKEALCLAHEGRHTKADPIPDGWPHGSAVVASGGSGCHHVYFFVRDCPVDRFKPVQRGLAERFGGDAAVCNLSRLMRLPGSVHLKADPQPVRLLRCEPERLYALDDLLERLGVEILEDNATDSKRVTTPWRCYAEAADDPVLAWLREHAGHIKPGGRSDPGAPVDVICPNVMSGKVRHSEPDSVTSTVYLPHGLNGKPRAFRCSHKQCVDLTLRDFLRHIRFKDSGSLVRVPMADVMTAKLQPPQFVLAPAFPRGEVTLLGGHGGVGKSTLALVMALHAAVGRSWGPFAAGLVPERVVVVSLEDGEEVVRWRMKQIMERYELPLEALDQIEVFEVPQGGKELAVEERDGSVEDTPLMQEIRECVAKSETGLLVIDNASNAFGGNENARRSVVAFVDRLKTVGAGAAVVLLAHIDKAAARSGGQGNSFSGSTAWHNSARSRFALVEDDRGGLTLLHEKSNFAKKSDPLPLTRIDYGVLVPRSPEEQEEVRQRDQAAVVALLRTAAESGVDVRCAETGPYSAYTTLAKLHNSPKWMKNQGAKNPGKARVDDAMRALAKAGKIEKEDYRTNGRHKGTRWVVRNSCAFDLAATAVSEESCSDL